MCSNREGVRRSSPTPDRRRGGRTVVVGADGCRSGWVVARAEVDADQLIGPPEVRVVASFARLIGLCRGAARVAVDMPMGLLDEAVPGGRACDRAARSALGGKGSSVFSAPVRGVLRANDYPEALRISRASSAAGVGVSKQTWNLVPKIREVDAWLTRARQRRVIESHPELVFAALNGGTPIAQPKRSREGLERRAAALREVGLRPVDIRRRSRDVGADDVLDAFACLVAACRHAAGNARRFGGEELDSRGLLMRIVA